MKKSTKVVLVIASIIMVILVVITLIISYFEKLQPEDIVYPGSGLSGSIFDTQNTVYTPNASLPEVHGYENIPYLLDIPRSNKAQVGEGTTYKLNDYMYVYTSEFPYNTDVDYTLSNQLGKILMLDCDENMTIVETMKEEIGYRNGFGIVYDVKNMYVSDGVNSIKAVIMSYYIELPEEDEDVLIGIVSPVETNANIRTMKDVLDAELATFRFDEDHKKEIEKRKQEEERLADQEEYQQLLEKQKEEADEQRLEREEEAELAKMTTTSDVDIAIDEYYSLLDLSITWINRNAVSGIVLISPSGDSYEPVSLGEMKAEFKIQSAVSGKWVARITGVNVGTVNIVMAEDATTESSSYKEETTTDVTTDSTVTEITSE